MQPPTIIMQDAPSRFLFGGIVIRHLHPHPGSDIKVFRLALHFFAARYGVSTGLVP